MPVNVARMLIGNKAVKVLQDGGNTSSSWISSILKSISLS